MKYAGYYSYENICPLRYIQFEYSQHIMKENVKWFFISEFLQLTLS